MNELLWDVVSLVLTASAPVIAVLTVLLLKRGLAKLNLTLRADTEHELERIVDAIVLQVEEWSRREQQTTGRKVPSAAKHARAGALLEADAHAERLASRLAVVLDSGQLDRSLASLRRHEGIGSPPECSFRGHRRHQARRSGRDPG